MKLDRRASTLFCLLFKQGRLEQGHLYTWVRLIISLLRFLQFAAFIFCQLALIHSYISKVLIWTNMETLKNNASLDFGVSSFLRHPYFHIIYVTVHSKVFKSASREEEWKAAVGCLLFSPDQSFQGFEVGRSQHLFVPPSILPGYRRMWIFITY